MPCSSDSPAFTCRVVSSTSTSSRPASSAFSTCRTTSTGVNLGKSQATRHVRVHRTGMYTQHLCSLIVQGSPQPICQSPGGCFGSAVRSGCGNCYPAQDRKNVDDRSSTV